MPMECIGGMEVSFICSMKRNGLALVILACMCALGVNAQTVFPALTGELLNGNSVTLPLKNGKYTLVGMAYSTKAEEDLRTWYQPVVDAFIAKGGLRMSDVDINVFFVPMYIGLKQAAYESTMQQLQKENRTDLFPYILFYKGTLEPFDKVLSMKDKHLPYFFLLDPQGRVVWHASGPCTEQHIDDISSRIEP
jgi:ATP10 protein